MTNKKKALVLFSGGLDSRLAAKIIENQGFEIHLCFIKLPFGGGCCNDLPCVINYAQTSGYQLHIIDSTKGKNFEDYLELIEHPKWGRGTAMNPCKDCKIFIFKEGKKLAKEIGAKIIATGEVLGQRPMSQMKKALLFDEEIAGLKGRILRPLSAKLLPETEYEKEGLIYRKQLYSITGRRREEQIKLAKKYKIKYPSPGGGCLLCEKDYSKKLRCLFNYKKNVLFEEILLLNRARMFKDKGLLFVGREHEENVFIEKVAEKIGLFIEKNNTIPGPSVVYDNKKDSELAKQLWEAYRNKDLDIRKKFDKFKI